MQAFNIMCCSAKLRHSRAGRVRCRNRSGGKPPTRPKGFAEPTLCLAPLLTCEKRCSARLERRVAVSAPRREVNAGVKMCGPEAARGSSAPRRESKSNERAQNIKGKVSAPVAARSCQRAKARGKGNKRASRAPRFAVSQRKGKA